LVRYTGQSVFLKITLFFILIFAIGLAGCGAPQPLLSGQEPVNPLDLVHRVWQGEKPAFSVKGKIEGAIVAVYGPNGKIGGAGFLADNFSSAVTGATLALREKYASSLPPDGLRFSVHLLRNAKSLKWAWLRELGVGYSRGLYALIRFSGDRSFGFSDTDLHVAGYALPEAVEKLGQNEGTPISGTAARKGLYLARTESYTEDGAGGVVRLYRASTLLPAVDSAAIRQACRAGGDYLCRILQDDDQFLYEGDLGRDKYKTTYNVLRHEGTTYALYQLYLATREERYRLAADKAWSWVLKQIRSDTDKAGRQCSFPIEDKQVKLGGTGLALIALSERLKVQSTPGDLRLGMQLANHILRSQNPDGSFESYWPYKGRKAKKYRSIYYPGEALLGLMRFYELKPDPEYLACAERGAHYFIHERWRLLGMEFSVPPDAWLMLALNELHKVHPRKDYADYCLRIADAMAADQLLAGWQVPYPDYRGGYFPYPPNVTPAGSRMEGLTAAYRLATRANRDTRPLRRVIAEAARFQIERQIRPAFVHLYPNPARAIGAFRDSPISNDIRIDFNQHNISGLLVAAEILKP